MKSENKGFLGANKYPNLKNIYENEKNDLLTMQIKTALKKMSNELFTNKNSSLLNKSTMLNYYCSNIFQKKNL